jgi:hypothetical protein
VTDLLGQWRLVEADAELELDPDSVAHFKPNGELLYIVRESDCTSVMRLTYRVEGSYLITDQLTSPREERTEFRLEGDRLLLKYEGGSAHFRRAQGQYP